MSSFRGFQETDWTDWVGQAVRINPGFFEELTRNDRLSRLKRLGKNQGKRMISKPDKPARFPAFLVPRYFSRLAGSFQSLSANKPS